jgi:hypothetical protein
LLASLPESAPPELDPELLPLLDPELAPLLDPDPLPLLDPELPPPLDPEPLPEPEPLPPPEPPPLLEPFKRPVPASGVDEQAPRPAVASSVSSADDRATTREVFMGWLLQQGACRSRSRRCAAKSGVDFFACEMGVKTS